MLFIGNLGATNTTDESTAGFSGVGGNIVMIIISILGIIINSIFSIDYLKNIISIKNRNNAGISAVEKILCMIAIIETFISICWLINNCSYQKMNDNEHCKVVAYFEIFLNLFDWLILSTSLYQIKIILLNPQEILESGKRVLKYIIGCLIISLVSLGLSILAEIGGKSPMNTCFISINTMEKPYQYALFWIFFTVPLFCFGHGGYQVFLIMKSKQYKNDKNNKEFFIEYSYFVITYIISSILLIISYVINYIIERADKTKKNNEFYKIFMALVTFLTCSTPLIVGVIRYYRTGLLKKLFKLCQKQKRSRLIENSGDELFDLDDESIEGGRIFNIEKKMLEKLIVKYFTAVSFALGKSKYSDNDEEVAEKNEKLMIEAEYNNYKINRSEILKDLDLSLNEDIKVLEEANIDIEVTEYNSSIFKKLRRLEGLNEDKIIEMFQPKKGTNQLIHQVNDSFYINSSNKLLMLKKVKREQIINFQNKILPELYEYFSNHPNSIICRIFGFFRIKIEQNEDVYMALTYNIHESIGGKWSDDDENYRKLKLTENEFKSNIVIDSVIADLSVRNMSTALPKIKLDNTVYEPNKKSSFKLTLSEYENEKIGKIVNNDSQFLIQKGLNNYNYMIFERKIKEIDSNPLNILSDEENRDVKQSGNNSKIMNEIKKYAFNSNKPNVVYFICINGV